MIDLHLLQKAGYFQQLNLFYSPGSTKLIISRKIKFPGRVARMGDDKCSLVTPRLGREDNIKINLIGIGCGTVNLMQLAQDRVRL